MNEVPRPSAAPRTRRARVLAIGLLAVVTIFLVMLLVAPRVALSRERVEGILSDYFGSQVELASFSAAVLPWPRVEGEGLVLRWKGRTDLPPLITADRFVIEASLLGTVRRPTRIRSVRFETLRINVPPDPKSQLGGTAPTSGRPDARSDADHRSERPSETPVLIDRFEAHDAELLIWPDDVDEEPLRFALHRLLLRAVALDRPMAFDATLTNPKPLGLIDTTGEFGPWHRDAPRLTPVSGRYAFTNVDLGTIKGIGGTLSSEGRYDGHLERIAVRGRTETPDFQLSIARRPLPLSTEFNAIVDGTNGETYLRPVRATLAGSEIVADGSVTKARGHDGRTVALEVEIDRARLEDILALVLEQRRPPIRGALRLATRFVLPPGERDVIERLRLDGAFTISGARFPSDAVQDKVDGLSRRGQGRPKDETVNDVPSTLEGRLVLGEGVARVSDLTFRVPGAMVDLDGVFALQRQQLDFRGVVRLDAKVSETTTGFKSFVLKLFDPLFSRPDAGAVIPIRLRGTPENPSLSVEKGKILRRSAK
jgi:hypothetical protein